MVDGPIGEDRAAVNKLAGDGPEDARVIGTDAMVAHDEVAVLGDGDWAVIAQVFVLCWDVGLVDRPAGDIYGALTNLDVFSRQTDDALDERFRMVERIPENDHVAAVDGLKAVDKFVDEDALLIGEERGHAGAFDFYRLIEKDDDDEREADGDEEVAGPDADFVSQGMRCRGRRGWSFRNRGSGRLVLVRALHFLVPSIYSMGIEGRARLDLRGALTDCHARAATM